MEKARRICSQWGASFLLAVGLVAYFLDWHVVHRTNALEGFSLFGPAGKAPPLHDTGVVWTCSGWSHYRGSFVLPALVATWLALALLTHRRGGVALLLAQVALGAATLFHAVSSELLAHLFDRVETLWPEPVFFLTLLGALLLTLVRALYRAWLHFRRKPAASDSLANDPLPHR